MEATVSFQQGGAASIACRVGGRYVVAWAQSKLSLMLICDAALMLLLLLLLLTHDGGIEINDWPGAILIIVICGMTTTIIVKGS